MANQLFENYKLGNIKLKNKAVMAPMTRSRAIDNIPNALMAEYYGQRSGSGLIVTEGTSPSPNGLGYPRIPAMYNQHHVDGWRLVTDKVHENGGKIFLQLMHCGRIAHHLNLPDGAKVLAPSAIIAEGQMYTDAEGMKENDLPLEMSTNEVHEAIEGYVNAAKLAIEAGFDGVEIHGANGYLIEQFLSPNSNYRKDEFGGSIHSRSKFLLDIVAQTIDAIGADKVGLRLSPNGAFNDMQPYPAMEETYHYLAEELDKLKIGYVHLLDHSAMGSTPLPVEVLEDFRNTFNGTLILCGDFDKDSAEKALADHTADLIAFGRPFLANPDLVERFKKNAELNQPDFDTFYTPGEKGYTDYPTLNEE
ncbi:MAG: alkene reductase [Bacteroidetes bacterium]|nr:alkene reductase [Bacteroidota bacterium]MBU1373031.1 alkene reductase [Bacteroidota bacterium]MBU1485474.1 alkene reductase [Bacteroidota bacterium]MBU1761707.1 alkene reductase [Bacteroidota bacterium]MBU2045117.1 alkene reductase [Bacteroidota bacterium]